MNAKIEKSMNERLLNAGITTIRPVYPNKENLPTHLEFCGKTIERPNVQSCVKTVKKEFGINI